MSSDKFHCRYVKQLESAEQNKFDDTDHMLSIPPLHLKYGTELFCLKYFHWYTNQFQKTLDM